PRSRVRVTEVAVTIELLSIACPMPWFGSAFEELSTCGSAVGRKGSANSSGWVFTLPNTTTRRGTMMISEYTSSRARLPSWNIMGSVLTRVHGLDRAALQPRDHGDQDHEDHGLGGRVAVLRVRERRVDAGGQDVHRGLRGDARQPQD